MRTHRVCNTTADRNSGQRVGSVLCTRTRAAFDKCGTRIPKSRPRNSLHRVLHATAAVKYRRRRRIKTELFLLLSLRPVNGFQRNILYWREFRKPEYNEADRYIMMRRLYNNFYFLRILVITAIVPLVPGFYPPRNLSLSVFPNLSFPIYFPAYFRPSIFLQLLFLFALSFVFSYSVTAYHWSLCCSIHCQSLGHLS